MQAAGAIMALVTPNGDQLIFLCDRGLRYKDEHDVWKSYDKPVWQIFRPTLGKQLTPEQAEKIATEANCIECGRGEGKGIRRQVFGVLQANGTITSMGTTCAARFFGVKKSDLFQKRAVQKQANQLKLQGLKRAEELAMLQVLARNRDYHRERLNKSLAAEGTSLGEVELHVTEELAAKNVSDGFFLNTQNALESHPGYFYRESLRLGTAPAEYDYTLTRWGHTLVRFVVRKRREAARVNTPLVDPKLTIGDRLDFSLLVVNVKDDPFYPADRVMLEDSSGWKYWFRTSSRFIFPKVGEVLKFTATVKGDKPGITFLTRVKPPKEVK